MRFRAPASAVITILQVLIVPPAVFNQAQCKQMLFACNVCVVRGAAAESAEWAAQ